jgi:serine/threonine-protein kinase RsbW
MAARIPLSKSNQCWKISLLAQVEAISPVVDRVMAHIREQHHRVRENEFALETALREGLANAVLHGCKNDAEKQIRCEVTCKEDGSVQILIRDPGEGFDPAALANPLESDNVLADHGRGIYLIRHLMDEVQYADGGREIRMRKS